MKKIVSVALAAILIVFIFASCASKSDESELVGKWELAEGSATMSLKFVRDIEFFSDGTVQGDDTGGNYSIEDGKLKIYYAAMDSYVYYYELDGDVLILKENETDEEVHKYVREGASLDEIEEETEDAFGENRLSASCDYVLASGTSDNGDFYELVANDSKSYDGKAAVGVIKNNKWLVEMTSDNPFIGEDGGLIADKAKFGKNSWFYYYDYNYIYDILWNPETNAVYKSSEHDNKRPVMIWNEDEQCYDLREGFILVEGEYGGADELIDLSTMKTIATYEFYDVYPYSEGLFCAETSTGNGTSYGFYDKSGNLVIDLNKYNISGGALRFTDGKCTFKARNDSGKKFEITIDKTGKVLSENPVN